MKDDTPQFTSAESKELCLELAEADSEKEAVGILKSANLWDADELWKDYGDNENNYSQIGNQQGDPAAALGEKFTNAVDAKLMRAVLADGVDPEGSDKGQPPSSTRDAVGTYFGVKNGQIARLSARKRRELSEGIKFIATGSKQTPTYTIIDDGEGQHPWNFSNTFLSLGESNKLRIPFVQGEFNMGGTGALEFTGEHGLQLLISRRASDISSESQTNPWGFTIVRRFPPEGNMRHSVYRYLTAKSSGRMPQFQSNSLPLQPGSDQKRGESMEFGSFIKLYDYNIGSGLRTNILFDLYNRMSFLLPGIGLPIRFYERREGYSGHSMETTMAGLNVRLEDDKRSNLEKGFPTSHTFSIGPSDFRCRVYAFQKDGSGRPTEKYRERSEGIILTINGQTHGSLSARFFARKAVGMSYLKGSLMIIVDCSDMDGRHREMLFQNDRVNISKADIRYDIENELEDILSDHAGLRKLRNKRREEEIQNRVDNDDALEDVLNSVLKNSPTLSSLFSEGDRLTDPFDLRDERNQEDESYDGKQFPTEFTIYEKHRKKEAPINQKRIRIDFRTDAENDYFGRDIDPGEFTIKCDSEVVYTYNLNIWDGKATLNLDIPNEANVGDEYSFHTTVTDPSRYEPFTNDFSMTVNEKRTKTSGNGRKKKGKGSNGNNEGGTSGGLSLPRVTEIEQEDWSEHDYSKYTAVDVIHTGEENTYDYYVNVDNIYLRNEIKQSSKDSSEKLLTAQFKYGLVLLTLGLIREYTTDIEESVAGASGNNANTPLTSADGGYDPEDVESVVRKVTRSLAPLILPTIDRMSDLGAE